MAWGGRKAQEAKRYCQTLYGWTCWLCRHEIEDESDYTVDHVIERQVRPDLMWDPGNWRPAHGRKHPELGCPGNFGRSAHRNRRTRRRKQAVALPGW